MPLFNYVWQYQNVTIEDFAQEVAGLICPCSGTTGGSATVVGVNTANFIPVSDGSAFIDSMLYSSATYMKTTFAPSPGDTIWGIELNHQTKDVLIGDHWAGLQANTLVGTAGIYAIDANGPAGNQVLLDLNGSLQLMKTDFGVNGDRFGFRLDFANQVYAFGEYAGVGNVPQLKVDVANTTVDLSLDGNGLNVFKLGLDVDGIVMDADESVTSAGLSGTYINVKVNGVPYKLALYSL